MDLNYQNHKLAETTFQEKKCEASTSQPEVNHVPEKKQSEKSRLKLLAVDKRYLISDDGDDMATNLGDESSRIKFWRIFAVVISVFSILATLAIGVSEFVVAKAEDSSAAFGLAFDAILDVLTSVVVLWRYYRPNDAYSQLKEHISCLVLGILFIISSIGIAAKAIFSLLDGDALDMSDFGIHFLLVTTSIAAGICMVLFLLKILIAKQLSSWTMFSDALNSLMGGIIALSMIATVQVTKANTSLWYLDSTVGLCVSLFLFIYGLWLLTKHGPKMYSTIKYKRHK